MSSGSVFEEVVATHTIHLEPRFLGDLKLGAKSYLNSLLLRYVPKLSGIPLCYHKVELVNEPNSPSSSEAPSGAILYDNPCVHIPIKVFWTMFCPRPGARLLGVVNVISQEHIGLLILGYFSAIIHANQMESVLWWSEKSQSQDVGCWVGKKSGEPVEVGKEVSFEVLEVIEDGPVISIIGSLDKLLTEEVRPNKSPISKKRKTQRHD